MNTMKILLLPLLLLLYGATAVGQEGDVESYRFPEEVHYSKGKIYLTDNTRYDVSDLTIDKDILTYKRKGSSQPAERDLADVAIIKIGKGSYAGRYALYGGLVMGLSAALALAQVGADPDTEVDINKGLFIGGFTAGGVLIGGLVGSAQTKWETLYVNEQAHLFRPAGLAVAVDPSTGHVRVGFRFRM